MRGERRPIRPTDDDRFARDRIRDRLARRNDSTSAPSFSMHPRAARLLVQDADRAAELEREVAWYRARLARSAWMPGGLPLDSDPPVPPPVDNRIPLDL